ncbi:hypothetical protein RvY_10736 [Ramazzottius varieornatus]|uniref:Uncharacterized protein n=1 Tax=Ramazzottius varieornatus TaxID=947166 RepID=A0A1D1VDQ4_RAMVA|nr:hypothetical protein RvY_10736 [Ramazzottius varieornatus]
MVVEEANREYNNHLHFELVSLTRPDVTSCLLIAANIVELASEYYYRHLPPQNGLMVFAPGCFASKMEIAPLMTGKYTSLKSITAEHDEFLFDVDHTNQNLRVD